MIPNHILILGAPNSGKLRVVNLIAKKIDITTDEDSHSGTIVKTSIETKYYKLNLNILIDEFPDKRVNDISDEFKIAELDKWNKEFLLDEFEELREVLDGVIFTIDMDDSMAYIEKVFETLEDLRNFTDPGFLAIVGTNRNNKITSSEELEDMAITHGFEFINYNLSGKNEYNEPQGKDRITELIETHDWSNMELIQNGNSKTSEPTTEPLLDKPIDLDELLIKLNIAKDNINHLPKHNREAFANKVITDIVDYI